MGSTSYSPAWWKGKRVFITGATGFIGSWLLPELRRLRADVTALVRSPDKAAGRLPSGIGLLRGRVEDRATIARELRVGRFQTVFHLASTNANFGVDGSPVATFETDIRGTYVLLEACRTSPTPPESVIVASSELVFGEASRRPGEGPLPRHPYQVAKRCAEAIGQAYHDTYGLKVAALRCPNVYGGRDRNFNRLIPGTIRRLLRGEAPEIRSDGSALRRYLHVRDLVSALLLLAQARASEGFSSGCLPVGFAGPAPVAVLNLVKKLTALAGAKGIKPKFTRTRRGEPVRCPRASPPTMESLGWRPRTTLDRGLRETVRWYRANLFGAGSSSVSPPNNPFPRRR